MSPRQNRHSKKGKRMNHVALLLALALAGVAFSGVVAAQEGIGDWVYKAPITITNNGLPLTDHQVMVNVAFDSDMQADFDDLLFFDATETTELPYWIASKTDGVSAEVWVRVPSLPSGETTIYMYYSNPSALSASNGDAVFDFFDDFESGFDETKWERYGERDCGAFGQDGLMHVYAGDAYCEGWLRSKVDLPNRLIVDSRMKVFKSQDYERGRFNLQESDIQPISYGAAYGYYGVLTGVYYNYYTYSEPYNIWKISQDPSRYHGACLYYNRNSFHSDPCIMGDKLLSPYWQDIWFTQTLSYDGASPSNNVTYLRDKGAGEEKITYTAPMTSKTLRLYFYPWNWWSQPNSRFYLDWITVRKFADPEPTASVGAEKAIIPLAGTNVRVIDTISTANIDLDSTSFSKPPFSITTGANQTVIEWRFDNFSISQIEDLSFDVILKNPVPGEDRLVNHKLELFYTDLNGDPVHTELGPQYVHVLESVFDVGVSTDRSEYQANEDASINFNITNLSKYGRIIDTKVLIEDNQGVLVKEVTTLSGLNFIAGETKNFSNLTWNTSSTLAGSYKVHAYLYESGVLIDEAVADFVISPDKTLTSNITTDKIEYNPNETVTISPSITSGSVNYIFANLDAKITVTDSQGQSIYTQTNTIPILTQGATDKSTTYWDTGTNPAGDYTVTLQVISAGEVLSTAVTSFTILNTAETGAGLTGTLSALPDPVYQGKEETFTYTVTNSGNIDLQDVVLNILIVDPDTQAVEDTLSTTFNIQQGGTIAANLTTTTLNLTPKIHLAILQAGVGINTLTLASTTFEVLPGLEIKKTISDIGRVLVWINDKCEEVRSKRQEARGKKDKEKGDDEDGDDDKKDDEEDENDDDDKKCIRQDLIENALNEIGVWYYIVKDKKAFQKEMRSNYYTDYRNCLAK